MAVHDLLYTAIAAIVVAMVFVAGVSFINSEIIQTRAEIKTEKHEIMKISAAHLVESCFSEGNEHVSVGFLEENSGRSICDVCSLCSFDIGVRVSDFSGSGWDFGYESAGDHNHEIFINLAEGDSVRAGVLHVEV